MDDKQLIELTTELQQSVSVEQAWHYGVIPKRVDDHMRVFYISELNKSDSLNQELEMLFACDVELVKIDDFSIQRALNKFYRKAKSSSSVQVDQAYDLSFLYHLIAEAKELGSSDVHIEIYEDKARIRFRIDGHLLEKYKLDPREYAGLVSVVKLKAQLNISEKRLPQDGRIRFQFQENEFDLRVNVMPTLAGEKIVMRILSNDSAHLHIDMLGFNDLQFETYKKGFSKPNGIILISGPTGSGKTTTLYATLKELNQESRNITTVEDPIEYTIEGINQVQLNEDIGLTFSEALRAFLRQDPDVIMLGEIRDEETAQMAIRAALTGHLVLSTIHTNSAWEIVSRLIDMQVPPFLLASTLNLAVAQRLVRCLCSHCKEKSTVRKEMDLEALNLPKSFKQHYIPKGCEHCYYTGYQGRKAIYEVIGIDRKLMQAIREKELNVKTYLKKEKVKLLKDQATDLLMKGETSYQEVYPILLSA